MNEFGEFVSKFRFQPELILKIGIERECFLTRGGKISPISPEVLKRLGVDDKFGYELSACQLEKRIGPCELKDIRAEFTENEKILKRAEKELNFNRLFLEVAPDDIPLDVYPDPPGRFQQIVKSMTREILLAACRVAGVHIHIGMPDCDNAIKVYNTVVDKDIIDELCSMGDKSNGRRLEIYRKVAPDFYPPHYKNFEDFYNVAKRKNFSENPRNCWNIIRISIHGTIEFRMFGTSSNIDEIISWAKECQLLCKKALKGG